MSKPVAQVVMLGHAEHGKSTVLAALSQYTTKRHGGQGVTVEDITQARVEAVGGVQMHGARVSISSATRCYEVVDRYPKDIYADLMLRAAPPVGAILVVSAGFGGERDTREHVKLARAIGIKKVIAFVNKADLLDPSETSNIEEVATEVRELLEKNGFADPKVIRTGGGSALKALETLSAGRVDDTCGGLEQLIAAMDEQFSGSNIDTNGPFRMVIETVESDGVTISGRVEQGTPVVGAKLDVVRGLAFETPPSIDVVEVRVGNPVTLRLGEIATEFALSPGLMLVAAGSTSFRSRGRAMVYLQKGGALERLADDVPGGVELMFSVEPLRAEMRSVERGLHRGEVGEVTFSSLYEHMLGPGFRFELRYGSKPAGRGIITAVE